MRCSPGDATWLACDAWPLTPSFEPRKGEALGHLRWFDVTVCGIDLERGRFCPIAPRPYRLQSCTLGDRRPSEPAAVTGKVKHYFQCPVIRLHNQVRFFRHNVTSLNWHPVVV